MTIEKLLELIEKGEIDELASLLETNALIKGVTDALDQLNIEGHKIMDPTIRFDKNITKTEEDAGGKTVERPEKTIYVARLTLPAQKKIAMVAAAFLGIPTIDHNGEAQGELDLVNVVQRVWDNNKLDYKFKKIAKLRMSEKHVAEYWYLSNVKDETEWTGTVIDGNKRRLSMRIWAESDGNELFPVWNDEGDMIAFMRRYEIPTTEGEEKFIEIYTAETTFYIKDVEGEWHFSKDGVEYGEGFTAGPKQELGKIPIVYYWQPLTEWHDVQPLIERLETKISNHADTNDYFDSPIVFIEGDIEDFADKTEQGKLLKGKAGAKASYLTWNQAPESLKLEVESLWKYIHVFTSTPDISFESMKGLGTYSGFAIQMLFTDPHMKAADHEEGFGECLERRFNLIKAGLVVIDKKLKAASILRIKPKFNYFLPKNVEEIARVLNSLKAGGLMSQDTAVRQNPLVDDPDAEIDKLKEETAETDKREINKAVAIRPPAPSAAK